MTERIYYTDPYATSFDARVVRVDDVGGRRAVVLDRTAFYPTSGGQPFDVGTLGGLTVVDVADDEDGVVRHMIAPGVDAAALQPGDDVHGEIDWQRRFDHMQQHTGQHVLSAAFDTLLKARTESFHLGTTSATIDLGREVTPAEIARAEADANRIVWEDRPVAIKFADAAEAATLQLRKESGREGTLRLIDVDGYDLSACGGTHVARTGAIGIIAIAGWEKFKGGSRIEFVCGGRALRAFHALRDTSAANIRLLSVHPSEVPAAIERMQGEAKDAKKRIKDLQMQVASHEASALADEASESRVVVKVLDGWDQAGLKAIASTICERPGFVAALFSAPAPSAIVIARAADAKVDAAAVLKALTAQFGGKGGGRPELAQGGGLQGEPDALIQAARDAISSSI
jgi:alanyl-tRNA synthetase